MKRHLPVLVILVAVLTLAIAGTVMAGPEPMMKGNIKVEASPDGYFTCKFKASGTIDDGHGFIHFESPSITGEETYYYDCEVIGFQHKPGSNNDAACVGLITDTNYPLSTVFDVVVLWVRDGGGRPADLVSWQWFDLDPGDVDLWLSDWQVLTDDGLSDVTPNRTLSSGNLKVR